MLDVDAIDVPAGLVSSVSDFCERHVERLHEDYQWRLPELPFGSLNLEPGTSNFEANVVLKHFLNKQWREGNRSERIELANWIVKDWGGIRGGNPNAISGYVDQINSNGFEFLFRRVASYSKILAVADMNRFAIYDQRVAVALNAIQLLAGVRDGIAFHMPKGRNSVVGDSVNRRGFAEQPEYKVRRLALDYGWMLVPRDETFKTYINTLRAVQIRLERKAFYELEMVLFANAEKVALEAMIR